MWSNCECDMECNTVECSNFDNGACSDTGQIWDTFDPTNSNLTCNFSFITSTIQPYQWNITYDLNVTWNPFVFNQTM